MHGDLVLFHGFPSAGLRAHQSGIRPRPGTEIQLKWKKKSSSLGHVAHGSAESGQLRARALSISASPLPPGLWVLGSLPPRVGFFLGRELTQTQLNGGLPCCSPHNSAETNTPIGQAGTSCSLLSNLTPTPAHPHSPLLSVNRNLGLLASHCGPVQQDFFSSARGPAEGKTGKGSCGSY